MGNMLKYINVREYRTDNRKKNNPEKLATRRRQTNQNHNMCWTQQHASEHNLRNIYGFYLRDEERYDNPHSSN